ncbi:restriction endonuclease [Corallococcus exiguus]|uniref:restriction endonuclease n=1 Tax=Corallococcus exiguus TaxID=83462 RepID=UPI001494B613|nr:restriction endonuclease [Corallococcus exiguus]NPD27451.1 restriction endonuclease [Corallococcus exiguus]
MPGTPDNGDGDDEYGHWDDETSWERAGRTAVETALESLEFDEENGRVYLTTSDDDKHGAGTEEFSNLEDLKFALVTLGEIQMCAYAPYEGGSPVFEIDADGIVENALSTTGVEEFFELHSAEPDSSNLIVTLEDLAKDSRKIEIDTNTVNEELIKWLARHPEKLYNLHHRKFEELVAELFKDMGYDVELTAQTRDGGRDVMALSNDRFGRTLTLIECKHFSRTRKVGVGVVRSLHGVVDGKRATRGIIATTSFFSRDAENFIKESNLDYRLFLSNYNNLVEWVRHYKGKR